MAVYKLFPEKDATLYSEYPAANSGIDQILEATTADAVSGGAPVTSRFVVKFNQSQIQDIFSNYATNSPAAYLRLFMSKVEGASQDTLVYCYPVSGSWQNGTGMYLDSPAVENGVSWRYRTASGSDAWITSTFPFGVTGSWSGSNEGGGNWYTDSNYAQSASLQYRSDFDLNLNVTNTALAWYSSSIGNDGFIIKQEDSAEFSTDSYKKLELKYFSVDTNTIYPPQLEIKWDDFSRVTGSLSEISTADCIISLPNNTGEYQPTAVKKFRLDVRPQNPTRTFTTSSVYTTNYLLPEESYWAIKDLDTDEVAIDFDTSYTKISADSTGNYFTIYMNGLEPQRYYKILVKTTIDGTTKIIDNDYYFKVING
jgi:hypothetical protein